MTVSSVVYARVFSLRMLSASWTSRTVASPRAQTSSMTSLSSSCSGGGPGRDIVRLEREGPNRGVALRALRDRPAGGVAALLEGRDVPADEVDDLAGDRGDRLQRVRLSGRAGERDAAADRIERVAGVADRHHDLAAGARPDEADAAGAQRDALGGRIRAQAADDAVVRDDPVARLGVARLAERLDRGVQRAARRRAPLNDRDRSARARAQVERGRAGRHVAAQRHVVVRVDQARAPVLDPGAHAPGARLWLGSAWPVIRFWIQGPPCPVTFSVSFVVFLGVIDPRLPLRAVCS